VIRALLRRVRHALCEHANLSITVGSVGSMQARTTAVDAELGVVARCPDCGRSWERLVTARIPTRWSLVGLAGGPDRRAN